MIDIDNLGFKKIAKQFPALRTKLRQAGMFESEEEFIRKTFFSAFYMTTGISIFIAALLSKTGLFIGLLFVFYPLLFIFVFFYMLKLPDVRIGRKQREISKEIVFAVRFLIIEIESGIPLYDALVNVSKNYETIGKFFDEIIDKVGMGTTLEDAMNEAIETTPSQNLRKVLWQIVNSIQTGSDVGSSLKSVLDQIVKEQMIEVQRYAKKLNPLAMFYMILAVIVPTLGITMFIILLNFISIKLSLPILIFIALLLAFVQFMFFAMIKSSRPVVEL